MSNSNMSVSDIVKVYHQGSAGIVQLYRPESRNALSSEMLGMLYETLKSLEVHKEIVIFKGNDDVFSAGGDIKAFSRFTSEHQNKVMYCHNARCCDLVSTFRIPFVTLADGLAMGAAATFAQNAKYRVITERSVFSMPEAAIGYVVDSSSNYFLPRLDHNLGIYLGLTGTRLKGFDIKKVNLASHFVDSAKIGDLEKRLIHCKSHQEVQSVLNEFSTVPNSTATELDVIIPLIEKFFGGATVEQIYENLRIDGSDWAKATIKQLDKMSPTSLKVCHRSINLGRNLSLRDCLKMEFRLSCNHMINSDLKEGVRAVLVDKDFKPKWDPSRLTDVTEEHVVRFFKPLPDRDELTFESRIQNKL